MENKTIRSGEVPEDWANKPAKRSQKDVDARWTKKHGKSHYGYKNHVNVDRQHKLVRRYHVSDAALHDSQAVDHLLTRDNTDAGVWADPAYRSEEMEAKLRDKKLKSHRPQIEATGLDRRRACRCTKPEWQLRCTSSCRSVTSERPRCSP